MKKWRTGLLFGLLAVLAFGLYLAPDVNSQGIFGKQTMGQAAGLSASIGTHHEAKLVHKYHVECWRTDPITGRRFLAWQDTFKNRVTTVGLNLYLTDTLKGGTGGTWYVGLVGPTQTDGAMTSGSGVLTSAAGAFTSNDVGAPVVVQGAGAAGADLSTTVASYQSATQITLTATAGGNVSSKGYLVGCRLADTSASHSPWAEIVPYSNATRVTWVGGTVSAGSVDNSASPAAFTINASATVYGAFMIDNSTKSGSTGNLFGMGPFTASRQVLSGDTLNVTITASIS